MPYRNPQVLDGDIVAKEVVPCNYCLFSYRPGTLLALQRLSRILASGWVEYLISNLFTKVTGIVNFITDECTPEKNGPVSAMKNWFNPEHLQMYSRSSGKTKKAA